MNNQEDQEVNRLLVWLAVNAGAWIDLSCGTAKRWRVEFGGAGYNGICTDWHHSPREALKAAKRMIEEKNT